MPDSDPVDFVRTLIALTPAQHEWLRVRAFHARTSMTGEIRDLVQAAMDKEAKHNIRTPRKPKEAR